MTSPLKAIRAKCIDCSGGSAHEVSLCTATGCPLYAYRFGTNPHRSPRVLSEGHRAALAEGRARAAQNRQTA